MNKNFNLENAKSIIAEASGVPVNTTFGSITKPTRWQSVCRRFSMRPLTV